MTFVLFVHIQLTEKYDIYPQDKYGTAWSHMNREGRKREVHARGKRRNRAIRERKTTLNFYLGQMDGRPSQ